MQKNIRMKSKLTEMQERIVTTDNSLREMQEEKEDYFKYQQSDKKDLSETERQRQAKQILEELLKKKPRATEQNMY